MSEGPEKEEVYVFADETTAMDAFVALCPCKLNCDSANPCVCGPDCVCVDRCIGRRMKVDE
jgi:hypothetical protein